MTELEQHKIGWSWHCFEQQPEKDTQSASCSCGWAYSTQAGHAEVVRALQAHAREVGGTYHDRVPPTGSFSRARYSVILAARATETKDEQHG